MRVGDFKPRKLDVDEQATSADWPFQINELSNDKLTQYKRAAALDAGQADKEGDFERGNKRFSGIVKATKKQFANDVKKHKDTEKESVEEMARPVITTPDAATNVKKLWLYVQRNLTDLASNAKFDADRNELYIEDRLNNLLKTANGQPVKVAFDMGYGFELRDNILYIPIGVMWQYRGMYTSQTFIQKIMSALDSQVMSHTVNSLANPPEVMQRRARRDQERQERYNNAQKSSSSEQGDEGDWVDAKGSLKEFAPTDNGNSGGGGDKKSYLLQLADQMYKALYVAKNKLAVKAVKDKIVAVGGRVEIVWNDNGSFNVVMYHPTYFKQGHLISLVGDRGQDMAEGTDYPYNRHRRSTSNSHVSPELRHVPVPGDMSHPEWKEPLWSFQEIIDKLGITANTLLSYISHYPGFPKKKEGIKSTYGSKAYYSQRDVKRWVNANDIRNIIKSKQGVEEGMTPPGEFLNKQERLKAGDKVIYKGKVVGIATGKMDNDRVIFKPNQNYGNNASASLPIDQISLRENTAKDINEFSPIKPPTAGAFGGNKDYGQPNSSRYTGNGKFVVGTTNNYVLTATVDKWGLEWDEDDEIWFLDSPGAAHIADASEGEIELPPPREQRNQIHDLVTDYLNAHNSADLQKAAAYYGHSDDGEMATESLEEADEWEEQGDKWKRFQKWAIDQMMRSTDKVETGNHVSKLENQYFGHPVNVGPSNVLQQPFGTVTTNIGANKRWTEFVQSIIDNYENYEAEWKADSAAANIDNPHYKEFLDRAYKDFMGMEKHSYEQREQHAVALSGYQVKNFGGKLFGSLYGNIKGARASMTPEIWGILEKAEYDLGQKNISDYDNKRNEEQLKFWQMLPYPIKLMVAAGMGKTPAQIEAILSSSGKSDNEIISAYNNASSNEPKQEGVRVSGQQIPGTKNRAKTAYYPTNVPPKVKKLDKPLTDKELSRLTNQGVKEDGGRAVDVNGWSQQDWIQAVKRKFPAAKIIQAKMIDGPCQAILPNGRTLYWNPVQAMAEGKKVDSFVANVKSSEKKAGHSDKEAEDIAWATANKRGMLDNKNKKKVHETIAPITVDEILEGLDADQKRVGQVGGKEKAKKIGTVLGTAPKKHPFNKRLVGE